MSKKMWFKAKDYGWGWYPATWQGWGITIFFVSLIVINFLRIDAASHSVSDILIGFIPETFFLIFLLVIICMLTGEKPSWRFKWPKK